jgi:hypothetical protein
VLGVAIGRCVSLFAVADTPLLLDEMFESIMFTEAASLRVFEVAFHIEHYFNIRPYAIEHFEFHSLPPLGDPFPNVTTLSWLSGPVPVSLISYISQECVITHPRNLPRPITWPDITAVLTEFGFLETLIIDNISFVFRLHSVTCSHPL